MENKNSNIDKVKELLEAKKAKNNSGNGFDKNAGGNSKGNSKGAGNTFQTATHRTSNRGS